MLLTPHELADPGLPHDVRHALRAAREARQWSLRIAADEIGLSAGYLCRMERGTRTPRADSATRLTTAYELSEATQRALWASVADRHGDDIPEHLAPSLPIVAPPVALVQPDPDVHPSGPGPFAGVQVLPPVYYADEIVEL